MTKLQPKQANCNICWFFILEWWIFIAEKMLILGEAGQACFAGSWGIEVDDWEHGT